MIYYKEKKKKNEIKKNIEPLKTKVSINDNLLENKKVVCFACLASNNLFVSYILSKTVYKNDYKILILSDIHNKDSYLNIVKNLDVWEEVILIKEDNKPRKERFLDIRNQLEKIDFSRIDILHYYTFASGSFGYLLFDYIPNKTKIILTQDGVNTYYFGECFEYCKNKYSPYYDDSDINFDRASEIWIYDKKLDLNRLLKKKVRNIEISQFINNNDLLKEFCNELNTIFNYNHSLLDYDIVFFDQPITRMAITKNREEEHIFETILNELKGYKVFVKKHPSSFKRKYEKFKDVDVLESTVPWELVLLNEISLNRENLYNKVFITYHSSSLINTLIFLSVLDISIKGVWLCNLLEALTSEQVAYDLFKEFINEFKKIYGYNFYDIESINQLRETLNSF